jgi:hypothetical protein
MTYFGQKQLIYVVYIILLIAQTVIIIINYNELQQQQRHYESSQSLYQFMHTLEVTSLVRGNILLHMLYQNDSYEQDALSVRFQEQGNLHLQAREHVEKELTDPVLRLEYEQMKRASAKASESLNKAVLSMAEGRREEALLAFNLLGLGYHSLVIETSERLSTSLKTMTQQQWQEIQQQERQISIMVATLGLWLLIGLIALRFIHIQKAQ